MPELEQAIELLKETQCRRKDDLLERIVGVEKSTSQSKEEYLTEKRFADGVKCPYCIGTHIQRNGKARCYQQYICVARFLMPCRVSDSVSMAEKVVLNGIVEGDETFFPLSYKGSHALPKGRKARHHVQKNHTRGVSKEQVHLNM